MCILRTNRKSIISRLEKLEKEYKDCIPLVYAEYRNGDVVTYKGMPPVDDITSNTNPIIRTYGSDFAEMVNVVIHPKPNRFIEDFE